MERTKPGGASIFLDPEVRDLFDAFSRCFDIRIGYFTPEGRELAVGCGRECSGYCSFLRGRLGFLDTCLALDARKRDTARETGKLVSYTCHGGMVESILPVYHGNILHGFIMIGQFRSREEPPAAILALADSNPAGLDLRPGEDILSLFREAPRFSPEKITDINNLFTGLVRYISVSHMIRYQNSVVVDRIITLLEGEIDRNVSLEEAAGYVGRSVSAVSHLFTNSLGVGFKRYSIGLKIRRAEELLRSGATVYAAAASVGYGDPYYFSRLFRKIRGIPPSKIGPGSSRIGSAGACAAPGSTGASSG